MTLGQSIALTIIGIAVFTAIVLAVTTLVMMRPPAARRRQPRAAPPPRDAGPLRTRPAAAAQREPARVRGGHPAARAARPQPSRRGYAAGEPPQTRERRGSPI